MIREKPAPSTPAPHVALWSDLAVLSAPAAMAVIPNWAFLLVLGTQGVSLGGLIVGLTLSSTLLVITEALTLWTLRLLTATLALTPFMVWFIVQFHGYPDSWAIIILQEANSQEVQQHTGWLLLALLSGLFLAWLHARLFVKRRYSSIRMSCRRLWALRALLLLPLVLLVIKDWSRGGSARMTVAARSRFSQSYPAGLVFAWLDARRMRDWLSRREPGSLLEQTSATHQPLTTSPREIHVLVLGESARAASFQINGYDRPTTPRLLATPGVCSFTDVIAPATVTSQAVPLLMTGAPEHSVNDINACASLLTIFRRAGFHTAWFSTQPKIGYSETVASMFARDANESDFLVGSMSEIDFFLHSPLDEDLLKPLKRMLARQDAKSLVVLHTMGSHWSYPARYPAGAAFFPTHLRASLAVGNRPRDAAQVREYTNAYDNTIRYTDWLLGEVITLLRESGASASVWYVSDHGETAADEPNPCLHGVDTPSVLAVPMILWMSDALQKGRAVEAARVLSRKSTPLSSRILFHTMPALAGIRSNLIDPVQNLTDEAFAPKPRLYLRLGETQPRVYESAAK